MKDDQPVDYAITNAQLRALLAEETDALANAANFVALLYSAVDRINWLGIYVLRDDELVLGPFQGKPACVRIPLGSGVCGTAAAERRSILVEDVHEFDGHIACDPDSRSELVVPLFVGENLIGVLDIDSPLRSRFTADDLTGTQVLCQTFIAAIEPHIKPDRFI